MLLYILFIVILEINCIQFFNGNIILKYLTVTRTSRQSLQNQRKFQEIRCQLPYSQRKLQIQRVPREIFHEYQEPRGFRRHFNRICTSVSRLNIRAPTRSQHKDASSRRATCPNCRDHKSSIQRLVKSVLPNA